MLEAQVLHVAGPNHHRIEPPLTTTTPPDPSVWDLIREVLIDPEMTDPRRVAQVVATRTPDAELRPRYAMALVASVREAMRAQRNGAIDNVPPVSQDDDDDVLERRDQQRRENAAHTARSPKRDAIRAWWENFKASRVSVADGWKLMGECTEDDLAHAERERREDAAREMRRADFYLKLRKLLQERGVETVAELSADDVRALQ